MCGINLIVDRKGSVSLESISGMMDQTMHRGPDRTGYKVIRKPGYQILFGTNRLRVMDEGEASDQPFHDDNKLHFLLYNGEIYNQPEIKNQLIRDDIRFNTSSDTEVLFYLLKESAAPPLSDINGMYAIVFIKLNENKLLIARDPWGMKPLYYYLDDHYFIISSEVKGILASGLVKKELNINQIPFYFRYRYSKPPFTLLKNIFQFSKGGIYDFDLEKFYLDKSDSVSITKSNNRPFNEENILVDLEELLIDSLIAHTQSVRPVGLFLSGGVDSTLLLALATHHDIPIPYLFSIVNPASVANFGTFDYKFVKQAVKQYHHVSDIIEIDDSLMSEIENFIRILDHPVADPAFLLTYKLSELAATKTNVVLSGAGADELFAGYNRHYAFYRYLKNHNTIIRGMPLIKWLNHLIPSRIPFIGRKRTILLKKLFQKLERDPWLTFDNFLSFEKLSPQVLSEDPNLENPDDFLKHYLLQALHRDRSEYLPEDLLAVNDRACMLNSLEMRMPYLDQNITAFVNQIPPEVLFSGGQKWILKALLNKFKGENYTQRPKEGFGFPFGFWIRKTNHREIVNQMINQNNLVYNFIDRDKIVKIIQDHLNNRVDNSQEIWSFLILSRWIEDNFN